ncbi:unnamed protein product [Cuscuta campestris]|uniref:BHLH domain-containing protein n=1 Tax=Cuscuta campestris TaxID=132261 RepID=A0A484KTW2_9ASTE|nr:unnamed protein product [Cuscuta campestris]
MNRNLLTDTIQSFPDEINNENEIGFDIHELDVLLQQSPPGSRGSPFSNTILDDSYVTSFLETLSPQMVSHGSPLSNTVKNPLESLSINNSCDDFESLVELLQKPIGVSRVSDLSWWDCTNSTSGWTSDHSVGSEKMEGSSNNVPGGGLNYELSSSPTKRRRSIESPLPGINMMKPSRFRKKTKPGSRSVPKDRMLTYACYAELRELIPNGDKMSIDRLLHRTIKQMYFLRSVAKHAKGLAKHQLLKDRKDQKDHFKNIISGVARACEIENEMMICPLVVEDLSHPGQMLIRVLVSFCSRFSVKNKVSFWR